ncbi:RNase PH and Glyco transf 22 and Anticodon 1 and tRNA-synt 1 domain containing protein [Trichuris trichiura]|uniref:valine--tRNA ligase n=1 Tax=Trichuris trichiura TaxID=36087 RepID=A0A077YX33_TRITR|nr:RNase PH and Glyco transf 22 and Anticodon 1 and tRNA-synt 1 domain containing protein [Trichuris trichiura]
MNCEVSYLHRADGSCIYTQGKTTVIASVNGPGDLKNLKQCADSAVIQVVVKRSIGGNSAANAQTAFILENLCTSAVIVSLLPKTLISIVVQELESDGSFLQAAVNAVCLALIDSGLPMFDTFAAATVAILPQSENIIPSPSSQVERDAECLMTAVFLHHQPGDLFYCWSREAAPATYDSKFVQNGWYDWWLRNDFFNPAPSTDKHPFVMCMPPPNVTGTLHMGHALMLAIGDCIVRSHRMCGHHVSWIPGFDHAGLATQLVVEKHLFNSEGLLRKNMSRQDFVTACEKWSSEKMVAMRKQMESIGCSCNWKRCFYTLDQKFSIAVVEAFRRLHKDGLLYRDYRVVNWSPLLQSSISDAEVDVKSIDQPTDIPVPGRTKAVSFGYLYFINYPIADSSNGQSITIATTRPETMLADEAIAVHPADSRYSSLVGRHVRHPLLTNRLLPVIADAQVDRDVGTGAVKVTPSHSRADFEIARAHGLSLEKRCIDASGHIISPELPELDGLNRFECREKIVRWLIDRDLLMDCRSHVTNVPMCRRTGDILEPVPKEQWFLRCDSMAERTMALLPRIHILPEGMRNEWKNWLSHRVDWCLSRQSWWGHRIPAYRQKLDLVSSLLFYAKSYFRATFSDGSSRWVIAADEHEAGSQLERHSHSLINLAADEDVLDTWFSSALIPLVIAGWPHNWQADNDHLFPLSLMETGHDILGLWVTRMAMLSLQLTNRLPFSRIFFHGMVRDSEGQKMSKSRGNVVDPLKLIEGDQETRIGADALRISLLRSNPKGDTVTLDEAVRQHSRRFCNKLWQSFKYLTKLWNKTEIPLPLKPEPYDSPVDRWILSRLSSLVIDVHESLEAYNFHLSVEALVNFWWLDFCDIYLEWSKHFFYPKDHLAAAEHMRCMLAMIASTYLRLLAPYMPYLAEELYSLLPMADKAVSVHCAPYPTPSEVNFLDPHLEMQMRFVRDLVHQIRSLRRDVEVSMPIPLVAVAWCNGIQRSAIENFGRLMQRLVEFRCSLNDSAEHVPPENSIMLVSQEECRIYVQLKNVKYEEVLKRFDRQLEVLERKRTKLTNWMQAKRLHVSPEEAAKKVTQYLNDIQTVDEEMEKLRRFRRDLHRHHEHAKMLLGLLRVLTFVIMLYYAVLIPFTKVEESFNMQAVHDILFHGFNLSKYDHFEFPGVVPRTFIGPLYLAGIVFPLRLLDYPIKFSKPYLQLCTRLALGATVCFGHVRLSRSLKLAFDLNVACWYMAITLSQFHTMFYASRTLPNIFALALFLFVVAFYLDGRYYMAAIVATFSATVFRLELAILYAIMFFPILSKWRRRGVKLACIVLLTGIGFVALSTVIDSYFWNRLVWPEGTVWWYNIVLNKSSNWGTLPFFWYFYSAIPRNLCFTLCFVPFALFGPEKIRRLTVCALGYVLIYSFLPHKELRFIFYAIPLLNMAASWVSARMMLMRSSSVPTLIGISLSLVQPMINMLLALCFMRAAIANYPGGEAIVTLHTTLRAEGLSGKPVRIHIDSYCAETGVTRFLQVNPLWEYNKSESLILPEQKIDFDYLLIGDSDDVTQVNKNYITTHRTLYFFHGFAGIEIERNATFPFLTVQYKLKPRVALLKKEPLITTTVEPVVEA